MRRHAATHPGKRLLGWLAGWLAIWLSIWLHGLTGTSVKKEGNVEKDNNKKKGRSISPKSPEHQSV
jgi:hypothetical protein